MDGIKCLLLFSLVTENLKYYERTHFKLFTNCHVSWDTMYKIKEIIISSMGLGLN